MYEKARKGESIELSPRRISIFQFDVERSLEDRFDLIRLIFSKFIFILLFLSFEVVKWFYLLIHFDNYLQAKCGFSSELLERNIYSFTLCWFWQGSGEVLVNDNIVINICKWYLHNTFFDVLFNNLNTFLFCFYRSCFVSFLQLRSLNSSTQRFNRWVPNCSWFLWSSCNSTTH